LKYKTYTKNVLRSYKSIFMHQLVGDLDGNQIPVMVIPARLIGPLILDFLVRNPAGDLESWFGYVLYTCVPDASEMSELYEAEHGGDAATDWIVDIYEKILLVNPTLNYKMVEAFQEPVNNDKVVHINFRHRRKATTPLW
jgi:hypothetical protein